LEPLQLHDLPDLLAERQPFPLAPKLGLAPRQFGDERRRLANTPARVRSAETIREGLF
jgi:hypothetical protein